MKQISRLFAISFVLLTFSVITFAQATATATATIVTPIAISKVTDMNFGNVAAGVALGTVVLDPAGGRSVTGGVTLPATGGTVTAASFTVTGQALFTYSIGLPGVATTITDPGGTNSMTVNAFSSTPTATGALNGAGSQTLTVGATLNVAATQAAGVYSSSNPGGSGDFTVTVNYN